MKTKTGKYQFFLATLAMCFAVQAFATHENEYEITAECHSDTTSVYVVDWLGEGEALYVYKDDALVESAWADYRIIEDSETYKKVGYKTGKLTKGGFDLRIITKNANFPQQEGKAHITTKGMNKLVSCVSTL